MNTGPLNIVLVDDDEDDYVLTRDLLTEIEQGRYSLRWVSTYKEALSEIRLAQADVYLVDYRLGQHSGLELLQDAFRHGVRVPIIVLTGRGNREVDLQAMEAGAADYLVKGEINSHLLDRAIRYAIEHKQIEERLRESESRYRAIIEDQTELICRFRPDGALTFVNGAFARYYGVPVEDLLGKPVGQWVHEDDRDLFRARIEQLSVENPVTPYYEHRARLPGGEIRWQQWIDRAFVDEHGVIVEYQSVGRDITEQKLAEQREHEQRALAEALRDTAESLSQSLNLDEVLERILANIGRVIPHQSASVVFIEPDSHETRVARHRGQMGPTEGVRLMELHLPVNYMPTYRQMYYSGQPLIIPDTREFEGWLEFPETSWIRSYAGAPIRVEGRVIGFLSIGSDQPNFFGAAQAEPLRAFADQASVAIRNSQLYDATRLAAARAEAQARLAGRLIASTDLNTLLESVCIEVAQAIGFEAVGVRLYHDRRQELPLAAGVGLPPEYRGGARPFPRSRYDEYHRRHGPLFVLPDIQAEGNLPDAELAAATGLRTVVMAGMYRDTELIGVIELLSFGAQKTLTAEQLSLLRGLADQSALAIVNARLFSETQRRLQHVQALRAIDVAITSSLDLKLTLNVLLVQVIGQLRVDAAALLIQADNNLALEFVAGRGFRSGLQPPARRKVGEGLAGRAALQRQTVQVTDLSSQADDASLARLIADEGFVSYLGVPLVAKGQVKGVLEIYQRSVLAPDPEWLDFLETLAGQAAIAIDNAWLFNDLQRSNAELILAYDATIEGWSRALDLRDKETEGHTQRVTEMTVRLARLFEISEEELVHIRRGALLHDIGKMGIPDSILLKPGPLTEEEWVIMKQHPALALNMLEPIAYLRRALEIPYCHHEKWDGSGYPRGLKGEQIPLAARIFAVVDVWDALSSDRPYRAAWPAQKVREHISALSGSHFDPRVAAEFLRLL